MAQFIVPGLYYIYLKDWLDVFPRKQIHIIRMDDWVKDPVTSVSALADFLELRT